MIQADYRASIIGLGKIGMMYDWDSVDKLPITHTSMYSQHPATELISVMDYDVLKEQLLHSRFPDVTYCYSLNELLDTKPEIVSICTPPSVRLELLEEIFRCPSVKAILCEKPIAQVTNEAKYIRQIVQKSNILFVPNLSRRWNTGIRRLQEIIKLELYGVVQKIHLRYTRGIWNTGSHLFDLIHYLVGKITEVEVFQKIETSSEKEGEPSFSFLFQLAEHAFGVAEAFDDRQYYMFEMDIYLSQGKISILTSGDEIRIYGISKHPLFDGYSSLVLVEQKQNLLSESHLMNACNEIVSVIQGEGTIQPSCTIDDAIYPLLVGDALMKSYESGGIKVKVGELDD